MKHENELSSNTRRRIVQAVNDDDILNPETIIQEQPENELPFLTLMEELLLLGLKDQKGYISFFNDSLSFVMRGCILIELSLRDKIKTIKDNRKRYWQDKYIQVFDSSKTLDVILDEAINIIKLNDKQTIANWIDLLSGDTWNPMKVHLQLRQVRERVAKGLVDKGILRTEKHNFLLFDMATHPLCDASVKEEITTRLTGALLGVGQTPSLRTRILVCAASAANLLGSLINNLSYQQKVACIRKAEEWIREYTCSSSDQLPSNCPNEIVAGVLSVFTRLDTLM